MNKGIIIHTITLLLSITYFFYGLIRNDWFLATLGIVYIVLVFINIKYYIKSLPKPNESKDNKEVVNKSIYEEMMEEFNERKATR